MLFLTVEINTVARIKYQYFILYRYFELAFHDVVVFLTVVSVLVRLVISWQRVNLYHEGIHPSVFETYSEAFVFILVVAFYFRTLPLACDVVALHARLLAKEQYIEVNAIAF